MVVIFLGETPPGGISFKIPGASHHARWMAKAIYSLKLFLFRGKFKLKSAEESGLRETCIFIVCAYIEQWFNAGNAASAPCNDVKFINKINLLIPIISSAKAAKINFFNHLWYLSEELVGLAFFDSNVPITTKTEMVKALKRPSPFKGRLTKKIVCADDPGQFKLDELVTQQTMLLFECLKIPKSFLKQNPKLWHKNKDFIKGKSIIDNLKVTNDHAERGVALVQEFNKLNTKDEEQFQFLLQMVKKHRTLYPDCKKQTLKKKFV